MRKTLFKSFLIIVFVQSIAVKLYSQISEKLFIVLPDSAKPKDCTNINHKEIGKMLRGYYSISNPLLRDELTGFAKNYGQKYNLIKNVNERIKYLNDFSWFWYQRNLLDSVDKYSKIALFEAKRFPAVDAEKVAYSIKMQAYLKLQRDDFSGAYKDFQKAIVLFKSVSELEQISDCQSGEIMIYQKLQLYDRVIAGTDSTIKFVIKNTKKTYQNHLIPYLKLIKARTFLNKFTNKINTNEGNLVKAILFTILSNKNKDQERWHIEAFTELAKLAYYQKQYLTSISYADSAFKLENPLVLEQTNEEVRTVFKGLSLLALGKDSEGISLLLKVNRKNDSEFMDILLTRLYEFEKRNKNYQKASNYQFELLEYNRRNQIIQHRGRVFDLERKQDIVARDVQISNLKEKEQNVFRYIGIVLFILIGIGLYFLNRYRIAKHKSRVLINQIDELANIQTIRIQEAENKIKEKIAQDIHDDFSSTIAASTQFLQVLAISESNPDYQNKLESIAGILRDSYHKARAMSHRLYEDVGEAKFWEGLVEHVNLLFSGNNMELDVNIETEGIALPTETKIAILMIVKEAIINVLKHSKASKVEIIFFKDFDWLNLEITDNGKGISLTHKKGIGLESIKKRVEEMHGNLQIDGALFGGTKLIVRMPYDKSF